MNAARLKATTGRILAVDFGEARTGLAVSDASRLIAGGIGNVQGGGLQRSAALIAEAVRREKAVAVVVGLPVNMNGTEGPRAARVRELAALLEAALPDVVVEMMDERMSTMVAARYLNETDTRGKKRRGVIDTLSAEIILQDALERLRHT